MPLTDAKYYLGSPVAITDTPNAKGYVASEFGPGWVNARRPDGKVYTYWRAQLLDTPWGH